MLEEEKLELVKSNKETLEESTDDIVNDIVKAETDEEFRQIVALFNLNQNKKDAIRIAKLQRLLGTIEDEAINRFKKPSEMSNRDILDFLQVIENSIDKSNKKINEIETRPLVTVNNTTNNVNIEQLGNLDRESREKVLETVEKILALVDNEEQPEIIDAQVDTIESEGEENDNN